MIGDAVKQRREEMRLTQEQLAEKSGVSRQTICNLERGKCADLLVGTLYALANALDTTVDAFLCR